MGIFYSKTFHLTSGFQNVLRRHSTWIGSLIFHILCVVDFMSTTCVRFLIPIARIHPYTYTRTHTYTFVCVAVFDFEHSCVFILFLIYDILLFPTFLLWHLLLSSFLLQRTYM